MSDPLAHSARDATRAPHAYADHVAGAVAGARRRAAAVAKYMRDPDRAAGFVRAVVDGATFHDLGKLDPENQAALRLGRSGRMRWDHVDAGVAHLLRCKAGTAAWIVRSHHKPGLPSRPDQFIPMGRRLRGGRRQELEEAKALSNHTDTTLAELLATHLTVVGGHTVASGKTEHGLFLRMALSCLVDGDHGDAAGFERGCRQPESPDPRWEERLARLDTYVAGLPCGGKRQDDRDAFYRACREGPVDQALVACQGAVGIGKTTAVTAWLLRRAMATSARRMFVVAPYTTILTQTAKALRRALVLPDEFGREHEVIAEHHHRADFSDLDSRDIAVLWRAPVVVTTAVQFFETLAACDPARVRKLNGLPGSIVFLDEAHALLPAHLWRQHWSWIRELATEWGCSFAFSSGSLARVWKHDDLVGSDAVSDLPDIVDPALNRRLVTAEHARVRYRTHGWVKDVEGMISETPGPRLAVFNTVQTAAVIADRLRRDGADVLHLSTALCPDDRVAILSEVQRRLNPVSDYPNDWTLVATSLVEAGVDLSFRTAFRERFSTSSLIQIGGRVNRHGEQNLGFVYDFSLSSDPLLSAHPGARQSAAALGRMFRNNTFDDAIDSAEVVTRALLDEVRDMHGNLGTPLTSAEREGNYPEVARLGCLITADTALVVIKEALIKRLDSGEAVPARELLGGSVQLWRKRLNDLKLLPLRGHPDLYLWPYPYDPGFLGYMKGALRFVSGEAFLL